LAKDVSWLANWQACYSKSVSVVVAAKTVAALGQLTCYWYFAAMVHQIVVRQQSINVLDAVGFGLAALIWVLFRHLSVNKQLNYEALVSEQLQAKINQQLFEQQYALAKKHSTFFWQQVYMHHVPVIAQYIVTYNAQKAFSVLLPLFALISIGYVNWFIGLVLLLTLPLIPVFMILVGSGAAKAHESHIVSLERLGGMFVDRLKALTLITSFNAHEQQVGVLEQAGKLVNKQTMKVVGIAFLSTSVLDFFSTVAMALIAVFIGFHLLGEVSLGPNINLAVGLYILLVAPLLFSELKTLGRLYHMKGKAIAASEVLSGIWQSPRGKQSNTVVSKQLPIQWDNFASDRPAINAKSIQLNPKDKVFLTGNSGAGKTKFLEALLGLRQSSHHLQVPYVLLTQSAHVLPNSIRENLCLEQALSDEQLWSVLDKVGLKQRIKSLALGLDTEMTEHPTLSGGETQRLCLARALLQPTDLFVLDEPTAHLSESQHMELVKLIQRVTMDKTVIWVSHKPIDKTWFDCIWHIEQGQLI
jgi:ATP-binding cassette subfamily C protein CydD